MRGFFLACTILVSITVFAQPKIDNVQRIVNYPFSSVQITGTGFSATSSDLQVWFGSVQGTIESSTTTSITVTVPASAKLSSVEVLHVPTRLSAKSSKKFMPTFSGVQPFTNDFAITSFSNADDIFDICSGDFNYDGLPDIAGSKFKDGKSNIMLLRNTSTTSANNSTVAFTQTSIALAFPTHSVACGDINGDGKPDLVATRGGTSTGNTVFVFQNTTASSGGAITFAAPIQLNLTVGTFAKEMSVHDMNNDGWPEIVVTSGGSNVVYIFENLMDATTAATMEAGDFNRVDQTVIGLLATSGTLALETADLTGDGWAEIIVSPNSNASTVYFLRNPANGSLTFSSQSTLGIGSNINDIAVADFDHEGQLDIVLADRGASGGKAFVCLNRGNLLFTSVNGTTGFAALTAWGVDVADMNGDEIVDFVVGGREFASPEINVFISSGGATPTFTKTTIVTPKANWFVKAADFDGDSKPDIAATATNNSAAFSVDIWKNRNCHKPVILNESPLTICSPQVVQLEVVPLKGVTYSWSNGDTGPTTNVDISDAGTVTVTAVGEMPTPGCSSQASITIVNGGGTEPAVPVITAPNGVCAGNSLTLSTATTADSYEWSGPNNFISTAQNPPAITNVTAVNAGLYRLRVKTGGCYSDFAEKQIDIVSPQSFTISGVGGNSVCTGQPATLSISASAVDYNFQWKLGTTNVGTNSNTLPILSAAEVNQGSYTVELSHKTISCLSTAGPFVLNVFTAPVASFTKTPTLVCVGTEVTFNASGSTIDGTAPAPIYAWTFGDAATGSGSVVDHTYAAAQTNVSVSLTLSYTGISGCSSTSTPPSFNVNSATAPTITADPAVTEICPDGSETVLLTVNGTFNTYTWSNGDTDASTDVSAPGTYSVETTDINGCTGNAEVVFTAKPGCSGGVPAVPKVFTPNGDTQNDVLQITNVASPEECSMNVFDGRGRRIFETKSFPPTGWDGVANGKPVPDGTYYYVLSCPNSKPVTGSVLIIR